MKFFTSKGILKDFLNLVDAGSIPFLKGKSRDIQTIRREGQSLLTLICDKKAEDREARQLEQTVKLWRLLMTRAVSHIAQTATIRGFGALFDYYKHSVEFENILFGLEPTYRDHTIHSLWVYLLGTSIIHGSSCLAQAPTDWGILFTGTDVDSINYKKQFETELLEYRDSVFCIIALCHDLAYPFEKAERVNKWIETMSGYMGIKSFNELGYSFSTEQGQLIQELLHLMSSRPIITGPFNGCVVREDPAFVDFSHSFEQRKHGILSSYLLFRLLDTIGEANFTNVEVLPEKHEVLKQFVLRRTILSAIASHSCDYAFSEKYNGFRFLLCLCDELEEFSRYSRRGRSDVEDICKSGLAIPCDGYFSIEYKCAKSPWISPAEFFRARAARFCRMCEAVKDGENDIREVTMCCHDGGVDRYQLRISPGQVECKTPKHSSRWRTINPDPENALRSLTL